MTASTTCGPFICDYPRTDTATPGDQWTCPRCGTHYRLSRRVPPRPWRNWSAPHGAWRVDYTRSCGFCFTTHDLSVPWRLRVLHYLGWWP